MFGVHNTRGALVHRSIFTLDIGQTHSLSARQGGEELGVPLLPLLASPEEGSANVVMYSSWAFLWSAWYSRTNTWGAHFQVPVCTELGAMILKSLMCDRRSRAEQQPDCLRTRSDRGHS